MNIHLAIERLKEKGFTPWDLDEYKSLIKKVNESNLKIWENDKRVIILKGYSSNKLFHDWEEDQITISYIYDILKAKYKNNLYFLLVLDWEIQRDSEHTQFINLVEKDELVCRKYVIVENEDFERVPFLQDKRFDFSNIFNYEQTFREQLNSKNTHNIIQQMIDYYFSQDYKIGKVEDSNKRLAEFIMKE